MGNPWAAWPFADLERLLEVDLAPSAELAGEVSRARYAVTDWIQANRMDGSSPLYPKANRLRVTLSRLHDRLLKALGEPTDLEVLAGWEVV